MLIQVLPRHGLRKKTLVLFNPFYESWRVVGTAKQEKRTNLINSMESQNVTQAKHLHIREYNL